MAPLLAAPVGALSVAAAVFAADKAAEASSGDRGALYTALGSVLVSAIGGAFALAVSRREPPSATPIVEPVVKYVEQPTSGALAVELVDLWHQERDRAEERARAAEEKASLWMERAYEAGWRDEA